MSSLQRVYSYTTTLMGSPILLKLFDDNAPAASAIFRLIKQLEDLLTVNREHSQLMAVNHAASQHAVAVSRPVFELIQRAKMVSLLQGSCFNLAIGPLVKCWKIGFRGSSVPQLADIQSRLRLTNPNDIVLDEQACSVFLEHTGMEIDLGAIAKGYIADRVRDLLLQMGIGVIEVNGKSVVTSGIYERYFELNGKIYHHILDPKTGYPLDNELLSVTVISDDSIDGDIYTTLLYGMGVEKAQHFLTTTPHIEAIFVTRSGHIICPSQRHFTFTLTDHDYQLA
jgi:FAD:protein FMN transferase